MHRGTSSVTVLALALCLLVGGIIGYAIPNISGTKQGSVTLFETSTTTATLNSTVTSTQLVPVTVTVTSTVTSTGTPTSSAVTAQQGPVALVFGTLTVPAGSGGGTLVMTVNDDGTASIGAITVATGAADSSISMTYGAQNGAPASSGTEGLAGGAAAPILCTSNAVGTIPGSCVSAGGNASASDAVPVGSSASAVGTGSGLTAGATYTFTVSIYFGTNAIPTTLTFSVTAQV